jgi:hypothetical protein
MAGIPFYNVGGSEVDECDARNARRAREAGCDNKEAPRAVSKRGAGWIDDDSFVGVGL